MLGAHAVPPVLLADVALTRQRGHARHKDGLPDFRHRVSFTSLSTAESSAFYSAEVSLLVCH